VTIDFKAAYEHSENIDVEDLIWGTEHYPTMFDQESNHALYKRITEEDILCVLKSFKGDKGPGEDGWTMELFTHFFDLFKKELLQMVEEARLTRDVNHHIKYNYIALILKRCPPSCFEDYIPISLCKLIYKVISKTIIGNL